METAFANTPIYAGVFRHAVDPKGRITVPAKWRRAESEDFYIIPNPQNQFLIVMPPEEFKAVGVKVAASKSSESDKRNFLRRFYSGAQPSTVDRQGRMLLPEEYLTQVGLQTDVILAGGDARFEIWNPDRWNANLEDKNDVYNRVGEEIGI